MNPLPTILVVTPTLGTSRFLDRTVASIASQTVPILPVLVAPTAVVPALQARYPRTLVLPDAGRAAGLYGALNVALADAPGPWGWFTYINDDDLLLPGFSQVARRHLAQAFPEPVAYGNVELVDAREQPISRVTVERNPAWIPALLQAGISPVMQQGMLMRRDCVERRQGFNLRYRLCADLDFWLRALAAGEKFRFYNRPIARFRLRDGQLSSDTALTMREQDEIVALQLPEPVPAALRYFAVGRYRLLNLPRYLARARRRGLRTSYTILHPAS
ncbi:MAG TPA: hypothetical protein VHE13_10345 [Opitutus sp.]|nr:hypothetical protein [Opitutus sp.]